MKSMDSRAKRSGKFLPASCILPLSNYELSMAYSSAIGSTAFELPSWAVD